MRHVRCICDLCVYPDMFTCIQMKCVGKRMLEECAHRHFSNMAEIRKSLWSGLFPLSCEVPILSWTLTWEQGCWRGQAPLTGSVTHGISTLVVAILRSVPQRGHQDICPQLGAFLPKGVSKSWYCTRPSGVARGRPRSGEIAFFFLSLSDIFVLILLCSSRVE